MCLSVMIFGSSAISSQHILYLPPDIAIQVPDSGHIASTDLDAYTEIRYRSKHSISYFGQFPSAPSQSNDSLPLLCGWPQNCGVGWRCGYLSLSDTAISSIFIRTHIFPQAPLFRCIIIIFYVFMLRTNVSVGRIEWPQPLSSLVVVTNFNWSLLLRFTAYTVHSRGFY